MREFRSHTISSWEEFNEFLPAKPSEARQWVYRGQPDDKRLMTTIERALVRWNIPLSDAASIEFQTIREFRRRLGKPEYDRVQGDTLYCLALMQHYGAPTRLLDCTYSPLVAAAFALEDGIFPLEKSDRPPRPVVWCFNAKWCEAEAKKMLPEQRRTLIERRNDDAGRNDETFLPLFQLKSRLTTDVSKWKFVKNENPLHLNERLTAQQGAFLCPADLGSSFEDNLKAMNDC